MYMVEISQGLVVGGKALLIHWWLSVTSTLVGSMLVVDYLITFKEIKMWLD